MSAGMERKRATKPVIAGLCLGLVVLMSGGAAHAAETALESVKETITEALHILEDKDLKAPGRTDERRQRLEKVIGGRFSYEEMAKRSLGAQWGKLNEKERREFVDLFTRLLTNSYVGKIEGYSGEQIHYLHERLQDGYAEVKTKITSGKTEIPLDYRLLNKSGEWRVYDVVIDGISLVNNYRGQFTKIIRSSSYEDLVDKLRNKSDSFGAPKKDDDKTK
jgi:phospholipid transport system substrate-binding protein